MVAFLAVGAAASCAPQGAARRETVVDTMSGSGRSYRIFLSIPATPAPPSGYGVIYLLDGNRYRETVAAAAGNTTIVAAVGYQTEAPDEIARRRFNDFTTPAPLAGLSADVARLAPEFGGVDAFVAFLTDQVQPFVRTNAVVNEQCEALLGHSLAGLAVLHAAFANADAFDLYVAASPSIWWAERDILRGEQDFLHTMSEPGPSATLFLSAGELEQAPPEGADAAQRARIVRNRMIDNAAELAARLSAASPRLSVRMQTFSGLPHDATAAPAFQDGLSWTQACSHK